MSLTQQMTPYGRPPRRRGLGVLLAAAVVLLVAAAVGITLAITGDGKSRSHGPTPAPPPTRFGIPSPQPARSATADPSAPLLLPRPARTAANGVPLGFPDSTEGAVSAIVHWTPIIMPGDENHQLDVLRTIGTRQYIKNEIPALREDYQKNPVAADTWVVGTPVAYQLISGLDADRITVAMLITLQTGNAAGTTKTEVWANDYRLLWQEGDWHLDLVEDPPKSVTLPPSIAPGVYRENGWKDFQIG
ncbi:hypothetical protein MXD61_17210 [Frankia sp. AgPm24]|uniref:hypothetical protein n=1 Tax=Frankia sp. AgPm24 TaxID=631128 RepID=UPI00200D28EC|nr:hypothetical protein [Frankia sp. AgPm24]MCK9923586.1 hypothetical protein [Frankia sp. AgPm24]